MVVVKARPVLCALRFSRLRLVLYSRLFVRVHLSILMSRLCGSTARLDSEQPDPPCLRYSEYCNWNSDCHRTDQRLSPGAPPWSLERDSDGTRDEQSTPVTGSSTNSSRTNERLTCSQWRCCRIHTQVGHGPWRPSADEVQTRCRDNAVMADHRLTACWERYRLIVDTREDRGPFHAILTCCLQPGLAV
ncbi:hypothetical protein BDW60DRAFT_49271 [Aspergillus nidulans var. acristatus]